MEEYKPNSHRLKEEQKSLVPEKCVEKVISGTIRPKKESEMQKFADVFISKDINNVKSYIAMSALVPVIKKAISDIVTNSIDMILYGEIGKLKKNSTVSKVSYQKYYNSRKKDYTAPRSRTSYEYDEFSFETRGDAEPVLDVMNETIAQYEVVNVADLYDLANISNDNHAANRYGWTDIAGYRAVRVRDGYILKLPKPMPLQRRDPRRMSQRTGWYPIRITIFQKRVRELLM